ncbi:RluA family pseudouridine synthase [Hyalangium rubrum]|uniref:RluA family pseudouridine synthase n=1 Tax=Hyalangium rubrum TaxID=3103134 RepID=A0ABU5GYU2_9BACT|nr:RluA family pseudouridine synthase [Hyalangium sp. s54d21]MDY7225702.1 RluA family pseudouridine synthase [Hyalangium sp. s54d21]
METWVTFFEPRPAPHERDEAFPSPWDEHGPQGLARRAAEEMQAHLRKGFIAPGLPTATLEGPEGGKMFGVLVVQAPDGRIGYLRSFSGMLGGRWEVEGFVPPLFDREARAQVEPPGELTVKGLIARSEAFQSSAELRESRAAHAALEARHTEQRAELRARHEANRRARHARREALASAPALTEAGRREALHALDQESRGDKAERRRMEAAQEQELHAVEQGRARLERRLQALDRLRRIVCRALMRRIHDTYVVPNARGERRPLRALFTSGAPPSGTADCAGPKLLAHAFTHGLRPLALAEFWWGAPPSSGGRVSGAFYPACKDKCGPLLSFMLEGLRVAPSRAFAPPSLVDDTLPVLFEDAWMVVVDKPCGLLSVPGRDASVTDSVLARLRARYPHATGPLLVHRLDLDTSGLLVAALDPRTHASLQRQFLQREVHKRYVAWLDGPVRGERGTIELPMRVDLQDRPRQIHDPVHGKAAVTEWQVLERRGARTRVALFPRTGRTHQLRVHAAHPLGLGTPIVGDRLYGHPEGRLLLHAEALSFSHPATGQRLSFERPAPF